MKYTEQLLTDISLLVITTKLPQVQLVETRLDGQVS